jgi:anaerobic selenocysteine-containing dehydrogenase
MLSGQLVGPANSLLPRSWSHRAIMQLRLAAGNSMQELKIARTTETRSTCPYCSVSCGVIIHTLGDKAKNVTAQVVHVEGDPDHPINRGTLCPKGSSLYHDILNDGGC